MAKVPATSLSVFTLDSENVLCHTDTVSYETNIENEDEACINEASSKPGAVGRTRRISASGALDAEALAVALAEGVSPVVTFAMTAGSATISGSALMVLGSLDISRRSFQKQRFELLVRGTPTVTVPSA